jgi:hypothetical protein
VANSTIILASNDCWAVNIQDGSTGNAVLNHILFNNHAWHGSISISADSLPGFASDHNIVEDRFIRVMTAVYASPGNFQSIP